jgi:pyruvate/2-oxoglutarate dehydrogenase complex dihydrolipoamide dehydrogenase (E3) component
MPVPEEYDAVILGSGEAGKYLAWSLASKGQRTAVIERRYVGGSCPNIACLPSKNFIHSAKVASYFRNSEAFGITKDHWKVDMRGVRNRKRAMVDRLVEMNRGRYTASGAELVMGTGRFIEPRTIMVEAASDIQDAEPRILRGKRVIISTGSRATIEPIPGLAEARPLTHIQALELDHVPDHLIVLGGGYVGLEFAQAVRRFGSRVTIVERNARLVHREDPDVSEALHQLFTDEGIEIHLGTTVERVTGACGKSVHLHASRGGESLVIDGNRLLVASGRTPNTEDIGLELAGVEKTAGGHIRVNERLETTAENVWAVGDCAGSPHFTHVAFDDFRVVRDNIGGGNRVTTNRLVPFCLFTDPELARVGLSEAEAQSQGIPYRLARIPMEAVLRTHTLSETRGFMKALIDAKSERILGFTAFGPDAGEVMAVVQIAISSGLPYTALRDSILTHPTMAEGLTTLFASVAAVQT